MGEEAQVGEVAEEEEEEVLGHVPEDELGRVVLDRSADGERDNDDATGEGELTPVDDWSTLGVEREDALDVEGGDQERRADGGIAGCSFRTV